MKRERLKLALDMLEPEEWIRFERFASAFLSSEYPDLRTVANASGDQGRDAELFSPDGGTYVLLQYSVTVDWPKKIRKTAERVSETFPDARVLIYVTNQALMARADSLRRELRENYKLTLDVHDREWFLERFQGDSHREAVAEDLASYVVDPYLAGEGILKHSAPTLTSTELQAALTFLQLQWQDDTREKGLTKMSFEALVRTVLRRTNSDSRMLRQSIHEKVGELLPDHDPNRVKPLIDGVLGRLQKKGVVRYWAKDDEYCLAYEEWQRVNERLASMEVANMELDDEIKEILEANRDRMELTKLKAPELREMVRNAINQYLLDRGEAFAIAVSTNHIEALGAEGLDGAINKAIETAPIHISSEAKRKVAELISVALQELLVDPSDIVRRHLRSKADAYTLFAFLEQTPDTQAAVAKIFSQGTIWLDANVVLPVFAEELLPEDDRRFTRMLRAAVQVGMELRVTPGVIEEVERHINRCLLFVRMEDEVWNGGTPFLVDAYVRSGRAIHTFSTWVERFMGQERPEDDIADYLAEFMDAKRESLEELENQAPAHIRNAIEEVWFTAHERRRESSKTDVDVLTLQRLARHDVENYLGVIEKRRGEDRSPLGYTAWWLTMDHVAFQVVDQIREELGHETPSSPVMSADFLVNYLSMGPVRSRLPKEEEAILPLALDIGFSEGLPADLIAEAEAIRCDAEGLPEHVKRRRVRDYLDAAKRRIGGTVERGVDAVLEEIDKGVDVRE